MGALSAEVVVLGGGVGGTACANLIAKPNAVPIGPNPELDFVHLKEIRGTLERVVRVRCGPPLSSADPSCFSTFRILDWDAAFSYRRQVPSQTADLVLFMLKV